MTPAHAEKFPTAKLPGESVSAYQHFQAYLQMGTSRTLAALAQNLNKSTTRMGQLSTKWHWQERLETYVAEQQVIQYQADQQAALERARMLQNRRAQMEDEAFDAYTKLTGKMNAMLAWPLARRTAQGQGIDAGSTVVYEPMQWRLADIARLGQFRELMRRLSLGEAVSAQELRAITMQGSGQGSGVTATITPVTGLNGTPSCVITIEGAETEEDEIVYLPPSTNTIQMPAQNTA